MSKDRSLNALIVDSSKSYRLMLSKVLENSGFTTIDVDSISTAREMAQEHLFDLICVALKLSDGDSFEFCMELRAEKETAHTPIYMLSASVDNEVNHQALAAGVTELFQKQDFSHFQQYIEGFLDRLNEKDDYTGSILYIEDSPSTATMISLLLESQGYQVDHFYTAEEGINAFNHHYYDLVLTDVVLNDSSGLTVVREVRESPSDEKNTVPIIAISSFNDGARKLELFSAGINDYVSKPVLNEELLARIDNLIKSRQLVNKLHNKQKQLERLALTDQLTNLYNRHYLMDIGPKKIKLAQRQGHSLCLIVIDIDHFKQINDTYGHSTGDDILKAVATQLTQGIRWEDIAARFGGEEFVILLSHCELEDAIRVADDIRKSLSLLKPSDIPITASFGVTALLPEEIEFSTLFSRGDEAVYLAKENGRNRVESKM